MQQVGADGTLWGRSCGHPRVLLVAGSPIILHSLCLELYMFGGFFFWGGGEGESKKQLCPTVCAVGACLDMGETSPGRWKKEFSFLFSDC